MRKIALALLAITSSFAVAAQSAENQKADSAQHAVSQSIVICGEEIRRFPSANFMDAVNGLFPWVFTSSANDFAFIIDGYLLMDINSISLHDIEEITFTRSPLQGGIFPLSRAGTFVIKTKATKRNKLEVNFNTQYNTAWNKKKFTPSSGFRLSSPQFERAGINELNNKPGHYLTNHLSLAAAGQKAAVYFSAQLNIQKSPVLHQYSDFNYGSQVHDTIQSTIVNKQPDQRLFLNFTYKFSKSLNAGLVADYSHSQSIQDTAYSDLTTGRESHVEASSKSPLRYYHIGAFINYTPLKNLSNTLWFEQANDKMNTAGSRITDYTDFNGQPHQTIDNTTIAPKSKRYIIRNELKYHLSQKKTFTADLSLAFMYLGQKASSKYHRLITQNGGPSGEMGYSYLIDDKIASLTPAFNFSFHQFVSGYIGVPCFFGKKRFKEIENKDKTGFYTGLAIDFMQLAKTKKVFSQLELSFDYSDLSKNYSDNQWLGGAYQPYQSSPKSFFEFSLARTDPFEMNIAKNELMSFGVNIVSLNNRYQFITEWSRLNTEKNYTLIYGYSPTPLIVVIRGKETQTGLSFAFTGKLIDRESVKWRTGFNLLFPKTKLDQAGTISGELTRNSSYRAGLQNRIDYKKFFLQLNILYDADYVYYAYHYPSPVPVPEKHSDFSINYILLGYSPSFAKKSVLKNTSVFIHARNPFMSKELRETFYYDNYAGIGISVSL